MRLNVQLGGRRVGQLLAKDGRHFFQYDVLFQRDPLPISPFMLPVTSEVTEHKDIHFHSLPCVISDSLPDAFGMEVIRKRFSDNGEHTPSPLQLLGYLGSRTMGALTYEPAEGDTDDQKAIDLVSAAKSSHELIQKEHSGHLDAALITAGQTAGGMMPKLLAAISKDRQSIVTGSDNIPDKMEPWLIKLSNSQPGEYSRCYLEMAYFNLAKEAGIRVPETMMIADSNGLEHFAIKRFDREESDPNKRIHLHTFAGLMGIHMNDSTTDYETLLRATLKLTGDYRELEEQFRRMIFNLLSCVRDDHAKNFSFLMDERGKWDVSPAYDLGYSESNVDGNWFLIGGRRGHISRAHLKALADKFSISESKLDEMIDSVCTSLAKWPEVASRWNIGTGVANVYGAMHQKLISEL